MQHVCSLKSFKPQVIPPNRYTLVRFPYGVQESDDPDNMHAETRDGKRYPYPECQESALIWPAHKAWGDLYAMLYWERPAPEFRDRFVRDPLGRPDWTATDHRPPSPGEQLFTKSWGIWVTPGVPIGLWVTHTAAQPINLVMAEFKLAYRTDSDD